MRRAGGAAAVLTVAIALGGCGGEASSSSGDPLDHPRGPAEVVLRVDLIGGFVPPGFQQTHVPTFTLYGDGTIVTEGPQIAIFPGPALPNLLTRRVTEDGIQRILREARAAGLSGLDRRFDDPTIADASSTVFIVVAEGQRHRTEAYALGESINDQLPAAERAARAALVAFRDELLALSTWLPDEALGPERPYIATAMRVIVEPYQADPELPQRPMQWPLKAPLARFGVEMDGMLRCGIVANEDFERMRAAASDANGATPWVDDGKRYKLSFRPLLPDESGC